MKFAWTEKGGVRSVHFIFSERETKILFEVVGDQKASLVYENLDEELAEDLTEEDVTKFLSCLFEALEKCRL